MNLLFFTFVKEKECPPAKKITSTGDNKLKFKMAKGSLELFT